MISGSLSLPGSVLALALLASPAHAAFHFWNISEVYTNSSGTLQFIEFSTTFSSQQFVNNQQVNVTNLGNTQTNMFTVMGDLPGDSANRRFLIGTAGIEATSGVVPDYIIPDNFIFQAGGSINFFGANSGPYTALPTDGMLSRTWTGGDAINTPTNFAGVTGTVVVPEPISLIATGGLFGMYWMLRRRSAGPASLT